MAGCAPGAIRRPLWGPKSPGFSAHPLWGIPNLGGLDCHQYVVDWLQRALVDEKTNDGRVAYVGNGGDGPFGACEWEPTIGPGQAYF